MRRFLILPLLLLPILAHAKVVVTIPPQVEVEGEWILLGQIARVEGDDPLMVKELQGTVLGRSPLPGSYRYLRRAQIQAKLRGVELRCPLRVKVTRASQRISPQRVAEIAVAYLRQRLSFARRVEVLNVRVRGEVVLPRGRWTYLVLPSSSRSLGRTSLVVIFRAEGFERRAVVDLEVRAWAKVAVAARRLPRWHLVQEGDVVLEERELSRLLGFVTDFRKLLGKRTKVSIPRGTVLRWDQFEVPPLVKRGRVVTMVLETPCLRATALGVAAEDGRLGDLIRVRNLSSQREVFAEVVDRSTVRVTAF
ncbi:MAG: flagella basal body P-ring formation protein FlgA [Deltaproteobacteria bacterium]|nr:MAG: flagella basal body P-ring formation protein FlgA [Deltaproteobacteria bacterium]